MSADPGGGTYYGVAFSEQPLGVFLIVGVNGGAKWSFDGSPDWEWTDASPGGDHLYDVAYGNGNFVAVGEGGRILLADRGNPSNWTTVGSSGDDLRSAVFGDSKFLATGDGGRILRAETDGESFEEILDVDIDMYSVV